MNTGIYEIVNTKNGKRYVGSAKDLSRRWAGHRMHLRRGTHHCRHLQSSWHVHGDQSFEFKTLILCRPENLVLYEQCALDALLPAYNTARIAGNTFGTRRSAETRAKISAKAIGRRWSEEAKEKLSAKITGRKMSPEFCAKLVGNKYASALRHSAERRAQISAFMTGRPRPKSPEQRAKIAAALRGRKATPEARANQAAAQLGKKRGPYKVRVAE